ncbi:MAG TPA: hypothetical protein PLC26_10565 [Bacillota bacterium]|jgi:hypothetical protein|nr:hypothetical protein [Bacillota bacterium]
MKINQREKRLLAVLNILLWLWALKGTVGLYHRWQEAIRPDEPTQAAPKSTVPPKQAQELLEKILALEGGSLPWPEEEAGVNLLDFLQQKAAASSLYITKMTLEPSEKVGPHRRLSVQLEAKGPAASFVEFLHSLALEPYAANVSGLYLAAKEDKVEGRVGLEFYLLSEDALARHKKALLAQGITGNPPSVEELAYYFPQGLSRSFAKAPQKAVPEPQPEPNVFVPEPKAGEERPAEVKEAPQPPYKPDYELLGIVYQSEKPMALLRTRQGETVLVGQGENLGEDAVVKITKDGVLLSRDGQEAWLHASF